MNETSKKTPQKRPVAGPFKTLAEAQAGNPHDKRLRLFSVAGWPGEMMPLYVWTDGGHSAVWIVARSRGVRVMGADKVPSADALAAMLSQLSAEDRAAVLAQFSRKGGK
jgi:hypothetical protein